VVTRSGPQRPATAFEELLDDTIFEAVEADDGKASAGLQYALGGGEPAFELVELGIDVDADGLEGPRCGILLVVRLVTDRLAHDRGELAGRLERARGDDGARDAARPALLTIAIDDVGDVAFVGAVEPFARGHARLAHAHVERAVGLERKTACPLVELHRGDSDVERHAVDSIDAAVGELRIEVAEAALDHFERACAPGFERAARGHRVGIAIDADHMRACGEQRPAVPARAERPVDMALTLLRRERGDDLVDQHGDMGVAGDMAVGRAHFFFSAAAR